MRANTAAFLCARAFHSARTLGERPDSVRRAAFLLFEIEDESERAHHEIAKQLRRMSGRSAHSPRLAAEVRDVLADSGRNPLVLLRLAAAASVSQVGHLFPTDFFGATLVGPYLPSTESQLTVADPHLHSGATVGLDSLVRLSMTGPALPELAREVGHDFLGHPFAPGVLLCALRYALVIGARTTAGVDARFIEWLGDGTYWTRMRALSEDHANGVVGQESVALWDAVASWPSVDAPDVDPVTTVRDLVHSAEHSYDPVVLQNVYGMLSALFLLTSYLRSEPGEGLPSFVDRFGQMNRFRKGVLATQVRSSLVAAGVDLVLTDPDVIGAEFRKTITLPADASIGEIQNEVRESLAEHLQGFVDSAALRDSPRALAMPVTMARRARKSPPAELEFRFDLRPQWRFGAALIDLVETDPALANIISAVDVVGDELAEPNWVFVPVLDALKAHTPLTVTCHAGESFSWPLQGIRSIGELLLPNPVVHRIGHALALDRMTADFIVGSGTPEYLRRDVIDDLCWLVVIDVKRAAASALLAKVLVDAGLADLRVEVDHIVNAWVERRSYAGFERHGLVQGTLSVPEPMTVMARKRTANPDFAAMVALTHWGGANYVPLDQPLSPDLADEFRDFNERARRSAARAVFDAVRTHQIVLESCPTSNMRLAGIPRARYHPLKRWRGRGLTVSIGSDDPIIFGSTVRNELNLIENAFDRETAEWLAANSCASCGQGREPADLDEYRATLERLALV